MLGYVTGIYPQQYALHLIGNAGVFGRGAHLYYGEFDLRFGGVYIRSVYRYPGIGAPAYGAIDPE